MNFTSEIKKEIITQIEKQKRKLKKTGADEKMRKNALLSAYVRAGAELGIKDGVPTFFIVSETEVVAEYFISSFVELFGVELSIARASMDKMSGRDKLVVICPLSASARILRELVLLKSDGTDFEDGIAPCFKGELEEKTSYIAGAFLGGGSCTIPAETGRSGYHLEFVFSDEK